jgi:hypothetical protein
MFYELVAATRAGLVAIVEPRISAYFDLSK